MEKLLRFYGESNSVYKMRNLSTRHGDKKVVNENPYIDQPHLVILGTAVPKFFYASLSERILTNGLVARCMVLDAGKRGRGRKPSKEKIPDGIMRTIEIIGKYAPSGNLADISPDPMEICATEEADELLLQLNEKHDDRYWKAQDLQDEISMAFWARSFEKVCKLAMLYAVSENPISPKITLSGVKWANDFVEFITNQMLSMVDAYAFENQFDEKCRKATRYIKEAGGRLPHSILLKRMHESKDVFKQIMETLIENGTVASEYVPTAGKAVQVYRLA